MDTIEEQLWNYIDDTCTAEEKANIEVKISSNLEYRTLYQELLAVNENLKQLDFEEPSLSFTRNVMQKVDQELRPVALKTSIDHRIIYSIAAFFILSLLSLFGYAIATSEFDFAMEMPKLEVDFEKIITPVTLQIFLLVDVALVLIYLDSYLRKGKTVPQKDL